jgi:hypothetical protein
MQRSISPDRILLLDAYFYVVVFHGSTVAQWRKARYQDQPEHEAFRQLLEVRSAAGAAWRVVGWGAGAGVWEVSGPRAEGSAVPAAARRGVSRAAQLAREAARRRAPCPLAPSLLPPHPPFLPAAQAPQSEAAATISRRFPVPRLTDTDQGGSQARFLLAKLNPSATYNSAAGMGSEVRPARPSGPLEAAPRGAYVAGRPARVPSYRPCQSPCQPI